MTRRTTHVDMNEALAGLLDKYAVEVPRLWQIAGRREPRCEASDMLTLVPGELLTESDVPELTVPLLAWRHQRRFVELKSLVDEETVAPLLMCRFACLTDPQQMPLQAILYREFDLVEWLSGQPIVRIYASIAGTEKRDKSNLCEAPSGPFRQVGLAPVFGDCLGGANVIVRLSSGVVGSVEAGATLPDGAAMQDRHEMIARRGVASDRVVDTQVGQSSVYAWNAAGHQQYTDVDAELFGLDVEQVALVRAGFEVLSRPDRILTLQERHRRLRRLVELACESDRRRERLTVEGGPA